MVPCILVQINEHFGGVGCFLSSRCLCYPHRGSVSPKSC